MKFKDYLNLTAWDVSEMGEGELRKAIRTLNDVANKRIRRLEKSNVAESSPSYQSLISSGKTKFTLPRSKLSKSNLRSKFVEVRNFLNPDETATGSVSSTKKYIKNIKDNLDKILNKAMKDPSNLDRRYKTPTLKKSIKKQKLRDFWEKYNKWKEIQKTRNASKYAIGSPIEYVDEFYEDYYEEGKTSIEDFEEGAIEDYEEQERRKNEEWDELISPRDDDEGRIDAPKSKKRKRRGIESGNVKERFEKIKIF